jgi:wobble nucleotide-excising tRNase
MITKINLNCVASYRNSACLQTDKKVNLIYGLNGTGKSTLSNYLYNLNDASFKDCRIEGIDDGHDLLVYNQTFIQEHFFEHEDLKGIFTLSKENKEAESKISDGIKKIKELDQKKEDALVALNNEKANFFKKRDNVINATWKIKTEHSGGDRVLEFCLEGYKSSKDILFNHICGLGKPVNKPTKSIDELKKVIQSLSGDNAQKHSPLIEINFSAKDVETSSIFDKQIVGNENSSVAGLIKKLGNSDWVKKGLDYLPSKQIEEPELCPFCQSETISQKLVEQIKVYFDATYEAEMKLLDGLSDKYSRAIDCMPTKDSFETNPLFEESKKDFEIKYNFLSSILDQNKNLIRNKIATPSSPIKLKNSTEGLKHLNKVIEEVNFRVAEHNKNIDEKENVKVNVKKAFWELMRWEYDSILTQHILDKVALGTSCSKLESLISSYLEKIDEQSKIIAEQQKETVNIDEAVININSCLNDIGITDFKLKKHSDNFYKIVRGDSGERIFRSLSEGEKMIISFLYFLELCRGKKEITETDKKKIVVIDDPISSLSHIHIFNIGRLIKNEFFPRKHKKTGEWEYKYEQLFILTHSLYFFYEITEKKHEERRNTQNLFRLVKNVDGSTFLNMGYEEIQNDYQSYWSIIKSEKQPPALIANCMRNIIEYFFNFVEKQDLNNFFQQQPLNSNRFQAFYRYINRESHSVGQNIFDLKEFNYKDFKDAFAELFIVSGYEDHYLKMIA